MTLPTINTSERLIHGSIIKCVDGIWTTENRDVTGTKLLVLHTTRAAQGWFGGKPIETISEDHAELPDIEAANRAIPQHAWELDLAGKPRAPWQLQFCVYLLHPDDASIYTFLNSTVGACMAFERLRRRFAGCAPCAAKTCFRSSPSAMQS